jgi:AraC-like DNA-binding protein
MAQSIRAASNCKVSAPVIHAFSESQAWAGIGDGWRHLHGSFRELGYSIEWHDFETVANLDWARSFHAGGVEICLNLTGTGWVRDNVRQLDLAPLTAGFYGQGQRMLSAERRGGERHQFITVELSSEFLSRHLIPNDAKLHSQLADFASGRLDAHVSEPIRLGSEQQQIIASLRHPPVYEAAQRMWYHAKALEIAASLFFQPQAEEELFCQRQKRHNQDRVQKVISLLKENLADSLTLEEIGKRVGCSHFHLSRIFSQETGKSIFQCLRELRLERAAEMLRQGRWSVTHVALEVGYSSPSHFSTAFHDAFGCCPGLYPLATPTTSSGKRKV